MTVAADTTSLNNPSVATSQRIGSTVICPDSIPGIFTNVTMGFLAIFSNYDIE